MSLQYVQYVTRVHAVIQLVSSLFFFSFLKGIITHSDTCYPFLWRSAVYKQSVTRSFQPQPMMYFFQVSFTGLSERLKHDTGVSEPISYLLLYWWQNLSIQQPQSLEVLIASLWRLRLRRQSCNERPTIHFVRFIIPLNYLRPHAGPRPL